MNFVKAFGLLTLSTSLIVSVTRCYFSKKRFEEENKHEEEEEEEKEQVKEWPSWADLEWNLLGEIVSRLCLTDQARFRAVCKNWLAAPNVKLSSLPWHGCKTPGGHEFQIYDPLSSPNHLASRQFIKASPFVGGILFPTTLRLRVSELTAYVLDVKHNWLFICLMRSNLFFWSRRRVILFSPFTRKIITIPEFHDYPRHFRFHAAFSTHPDSPDCVFCMLAVDQKIIVVLTYHNGDKEWTPTKFNMLPDFQTSVCIPHILGGILYILNVYGQVASYNILDRCLKFERLLPDEFIVNNSYSRRIKSFVFNGELMILCFNKNVKNDANFPGKQYVRRYDRSLKVWIPVATLGDYTIFFNDKFINIFIINTKDTTCNGVLSNKIYRFFDGGCFVYSIVNGEIVQFKESIYSNLLEDGGNDLPEYKYNYATPDAKLAYWLEAPCVRSSMERQ